MEHYLRLLNVEFDWLSEALNEAHAVACPSPMVTVDHKKHTFCMFLVPESAQPIDGRPSTTVLVDGVNLNVEPSFCYFGDMLSSGGGCEQAIKARCCVVWGKFRKLLPILTFVISC